MKDRLALADAAEEVFHASEIVLHQLGLSVPLYTGGEVSSVSASIDDIVQVGYNYSTADHKKLVAHHQPSLLRREDFFRRSKDAIRSFLPEDG